MLWLPKLCPRSNLAIGLTESVLGQIVSQCVTSVFRPIPKGWVTFVISLGIVNFARVIGFHQETLCDLGGVVIVTTVDS